MQLLCLAERHRGDHGRGGAAMHQQYRAPGTLRGRMRSASAAPLLPLYDLSLHLLALISYVEFTRGCDDGHTVAYGKEAA